MNKVQKIDYVKKVSNHLEQKNVFEIFEKLTRELIVHQPENPIDFLIDRLSKPNGNFSQNSRSKVLPIFLSDQLVNLSLG